MRSSLPKLVAGLFGLLVLACNGGCASRPAGPPADATPPGWTGVGNHLQLAMDGALWRAANSVSLVQGTVRFDAPQELLGYRARYALDRNSAPLVPGIEPGPTSPLGAEHIAHGLGLQLPLFFSAAPLKLEVEDRIQAVLTVNGNVESESRQAHLSWAPNGLDLGLNWQDSGQMLTHTLVCGLDGHLRLPLPQTRRPQTVELAGRQCRVMAPDRGFEELSLQAWSAAWSRQGSRTVSSLRLTVIEPESGAAWDGATPDPLPPAYELDLSHSRPLGPFQSSAVLRLRRLQATSPATPGTQWSTEARLSRPLRPFTLTASLLHAPDPLWFIAAPGQDLHRSQLALGLNFRRWVQQALATPSADMGLSLNWREPVHLTQAVEGAVNWNFSMKW